MVFMLYEYLKDKKCNFRKIDRNLDFCFAPLVGLGVYASYLYVQLGDYLAFLRAQASYLEKHLTMPWEPLNKYLAYLFTSSPTPFFISRDIDFLFFLISFILSFIVLFRLRNFLWNILPFSIIYGHFYR